MTGNQRTEIKMENIEITEEILPSSLVEDTSTVEETCTVGDISTVDNTCIVEETCTLEDTCTVEDTCKKEDVKVEISFIAFVLTFIFNVVFLKLSLI